MARVRVPALVIMAAVLAGFLMGSVLSGQVQAGSPLNDKLHVFTEILNFADRFYVEEVDAVDLVEGGIRGMLEDLDPHSTYVDPDTYSRMSERNSGQYDGIGISFEIRDGWITVISAIEGGPSAHLGIRPGDRIIKIEGESAKDLQSEEVVAKLKGARGTEVAITVERPGVKKLFEYTIVRDRIPIYSVPYAFMLDDGKTGYVRAIRFSATTADELEAALGQLEEHGMERLIFDLRGNSGGYLNQAIEVADRFIKGDEVIVYTKGRINGSDQHYYSSDSATHPHFPLIVLVNHGSASASEIVAGAVQDHDRGLVLGATTFGKGLVQRQYSLSDGSALLLTVARYYTPSGRLIQRSYEDREAYLDHFRRLNEGEMEEESTEGRPVYHTLNEGRTVYGGGGISPDHVLDEDYNLTEAQTRLEQLRLFFEYANEFAAKHPEVAQTEETAFIREFRLPDAALEEFTARASANEELELSEEDIRAEAEYIRGGIKREIAGNLWGINARYRAIIQDDPMVDEVLGYFPDAADMARLYAKLALND